MKITNREPKNNLYYDEIYKVSQEYKQNFEKSAYYNVWFELIGCLSPQKDILIYDAGCGTGQLLSMLEHYNYFNLIGFDFSMEAVIQAVERTQKASVFCGDIYNINIISDVVICTEVLEHIENDCEVFEMWDTKQIIITVPDFDDPAHVRYFESKEDVVKRYGKYFKSFEIMKVEKWFILNGYKK